MIGAQGVIVNTVILYCLGNQFLLHYTVWWILKIVSEWQKLKCHYQYSHALLLWQPIFTALYCVVHFENSQRSGKRWGEGCLLIALLFLTPWSYNLMMWSNRHCNNSTTTQSRPPSLENLGFVEIPYLGSLNLQIERVIGNASFSLFFSWEMRSENHELEWKFSEFILLLFAFTSTRSSRTWHNLMNLLFSACRF